MIISATEFKTNLGKYIDYISANDDDITVTKNGHKVMTVTKPKLSATDRLISLLDDSNRNWDYDQLKKKALEEKYEITL